jgi:PKHD-type hydroxylase
MIGGVFDMLKLLVESIRNYIQGGNMTEYDYKVDLARDRLQVRHSTVVGFPYGSDNNERINDFIEKYIVMANSECFGFDLNGFREFQIAEYREGGHYDEHFDMRMDNRASVRKLGITVQLSDPKEYSGGEFMFSEDIGTPNQEIIKQKGTVIVFPSFLYHKVMPVSRGRRYSLVGWYEGSNWR